MDLWRVKGAGRTLGRSGCRALGKVGVPWAVAESRRLMGCQALRGLSWWLVVGRTPVKN